MKQPRTLGLPPLKLGFIPFRPFLIWLCLSFLSLGLESGSGAQARIPGPWGGAVQVLHYTFSLWLNDSSKEIRGLALLQIRTLREQVDSFRLNLDPPGRERSGGMYLDSLDLGGSPLRFRRDSSRLTLYLPDSLKTGITYELKIRYHGIPRDGLIISRNKFGERVFFGDNWPQRAHDWLPLVDRPGAKAGVDFKVIAPDSFKVVANGRLIEEDELAGGYRQTHWRENKPIPPYTMVIGAARFSVRYLKGPQGLPLESWVYWQDRRNGFRQLNEARQILKLYIPLLGPFPFEKLANVESTTRYGGMENSSNIFYTEKAVGGPASLGALLAHEIAHQWFGDAVTERQWNHLWLSEGFASFLADYYIRKTWGSDSLAVRLAREKKIIFLFERINPRAVVPALSVKPETLLNPNSYQKGAYTLRMLRNYLGAKIFWKGIRAYYQKFRGQSVLTSDFEHVMEGVSGKPLNWFFRQWIYGSGHPVLMGIWQISPGGKNLLIALTQVQKGPRFRFPLTLRIRYGGGQFRDLRVWVNKRRLSLRLPLRRMPLAIIPDPKQELLLTAIFSRR